MHPAADTRLAGAVQGHAHDEIVAVISPQRHARHKARLGLVQADARAALQLGEADEVVTDLREGRQVGAAGVRG